MHRFRTLSVALCALLTLFGGCVYAADMSSSGANRCELAAMGAQAPRLGIGVLAEDMDGGLLLGVSPYTGSLHTGILSELLKSAQIKRVLWMGELRYSDGPNNKITVFEANETSSHSIKLREERLFQDGRPVTVGNTVEAIPRELRARGFRGHRFDVDNQRLARELNHIKSDLRHHIGTALNHLYTASVAASTSLPRHVREEILDLLRKTALDDIRIARFVIRSMIDDDRLDEERVRPLLNLAEEILNTDLPLERFRQLDDRLMNQLILDLARLINPESGLIPVWIYPVAR